ncbi:hypothetical protein WUBG_15577, partial [Wuchereria bancrofti]
MSMAGKAFPAAVNVVLLLYDPCCMKRRKAGRKMTSCRELMVTSYYPHDNTQWTDACEGVS